MNKGSLTLVFGVVLAQACRGGEADPVECPRSTLASDLHRDAAALARALTESDARLCSAMRDAPHSPVRVVLSFSRLLRPDEVVTLVEGEALGPFMLDTRYGPSRGQRPVGDALATELGRDRAGFDRWLAARTQVVARARATRVVGDAAITDAALVRIEEEVRRARDTGPLYVALGVALSAEALPRVFRDPRVRYVVDADLMVYPKGVDPETGEWE